MNNWEEIRLADLASDEVNSFIDGDWIELPYITDSGIRLIQTGNVGRGFFKDNSKKYISEDSFHLLNCKEVKPGDIIICRLADPIGRACRVPKLNTKCITSVDVTIFRVNKSKYDDDFILQILNTDVFLQKANEVAGGTTRQRISRTNLGTLKINIPKDKNIQSKIAKILSTADAVIEKTQSAISKYKAIKQGMLQDLFTRGIDLNTNKLRPRFEDAPELYKESKLGMIPREWEVEKIGKIFRFNQGVQCPVELQKLHQGENEVRFIRIIDLTNEGEPPRYIADPGSQYHINSNDLFMVRYGSPGLVGYGYEGVIANNLFRIISTGELEILNSFYRYYLTSINDKLTALSASTTMPAINFDSLNKLHVIYPQIFEQVEIEKRIKAIDKKLQTEQNYLQKMQSLKKGLMEDLLSGKKCLNLDFQDEQINQDSKTILQSVNRVNQDADNYPVNPKIE